VNIRNDDGSIGGYYGQDNSGNVVYGCPEKLEYIPVENKLGSNMLKK
jgi:hypothetical protein